MSFLDKIWPWMKVSHKPGEIAKVSGQYTDTRTRKQSTVTKGEPLPPSSKAGAKWMLTDKTRHKESKQVKTTKKKK
jgi:hypothetical protein